MGKKNKIIHKIEDIDEEALLASMADLSAQGLGKDKMTTEASQAQVSETLTMDTQSENEDTADELPIRSSKSKHESAYKAIFLQPRTLKSRQCVYISMDVHETIVQIVKQIADKSLSVGIYIDTVLRQHLEENKQEINLLYRKKKDDLIK